jgi:hypothetical protein
VRSRCKSKSVRIIGRLIIVVYSSVEVRVGVVGTMSTVQRANGAHGRVRWYGIVAGIWKIVERSAG